MGSDLRDGCRYSVLSSFGASRLRSWGKNPRGVGARLPGNRSKRGNYEYCAIENVVLQSELNCDILYLPENTNQEFRVTPAQTPIQESRELSTTAGAPARVRCPGRSDSGPGQSAPAPTAALHPCHGCETGKILGGSDSSYGIDRTTALRPQYIRPLCRVRKVGCFYMLLNLEIFFCRIINYKELLILFCKSK